MCEIGTGQDILVSEFPDLDFVWLDTEESIGEVFWLPAKAFSKAKANKAKRR
jgi:ribosomal protein L3 glutamine methyltransferase